MIIFQMEVIAACGKLWIWSSGSICAEKCCKMDSFRIFLKKALKILLVLEIYMKQMILFQMEVVPCSGKICIMSYGAILDDPESEFWILWIILEMA